MAVVAKDNVVFEATLYNREVRSYIRSGRKHPRLYAGWAFQNIITIKARSLEDARTRIKSTYPENDGFVLTGIEPCHQFGWHAG